MLTKENLSDKLVMIIKRRIIHNELKSGQVLQETGLSKEWGISRSPVRDALRTLEQQRLIERKPGGSYQVAELSLDYIVHFYDTINLMAYYGITRAIEKATPGEMRSFETIIEKIEQSLQKKDVDMNIQGTMDFSRAILRVAGNPIVEKFLTELMPGAERIHYASITHLPDNLEIIVDSMKKCFQSILEKDAQKAVDAFSDFIVVHKKMALEGLTGSGHAPSESNATDGRDENKRKSLGLGI